MNQVKSTALIRKDIFILLRKISEITGKSLSKVLSDCFQHIISQNTFNNPSIVNSNIKYQARSNDFYIVHYQIDYQIYEACLDLKKILKKSLSRIINETIRKVFIDLIGFSKRTNEFIRLYLIISSNWKSKSFRYFIKAKYDSIFSLYRISINSQTS